MLSSLIFTFAPIPLTDELSPLAHAAALARKRHAETFENIIPRHRISPLSSAKPSGAGEPAMVS